MSNPLETGPGPSPQPWSRFLAPLAAGALLCAAAGFLVIGLLPAVSLKARIDAMASEGVSNGFPLARIASLQGRAVAAAAGSLLLAVVLWRFRRRVAVIQEAAVSTLREALGWTSQQFRPIRVELALLTLIALALRLLFLNQPMRVDESSTYLEFVSKNWLVAISNYGAPNNHILHTVIAKLFTAVFGGEPWAIRLAAMVAGTFMVPAAALAAAAIHGTRAAIPAAALLSVCWPWIFYSSNARGYTLAGLLLLLLIPLAARLRSGPSLGAWIWFALLAALCLFTVPVMAFALVPPGLWILAARPRAAGELASAALAAVTLTLVLYAPALAATGIRQSITPEMTPLPFHLAPPKIFEFAAGLWRQCHEGLPAWAPYLLIASALAAWRSASLALISAVWFVVALLAYPAMPYLRLWLWITLPWLLWAAGGLGRIAAPRRLALAILPLVLWQAYRIHDSGSIPSSFETGVFREAAAAARFMKEHWQPGDQVKTDADPAPLRYEMRRLGLHYRPCAGGRCWAIVRTPEDDPSSALLSLGRRSIYLIPQAAQSP